MPQLRLAPPTVYHEKVNKRNHFSPGASSGGLMDAEKPSRNRQLRDLKVKSPQVRFPLKSKIFGKFCVSISLFFLVNWIVLVMNPHAMNVLQVRRRPV